MPYFLLEFLSCPLVDPEEVVDPVLERDIVVQRHVGLTKKLYGNPCLPALSMSDLTRSCWLATYIACALCRLWSRFPRYPSVPPPRNVAVILCGLRWGYLTAGSALASCKTVHARMRGSYPAFDIPRVAFQRATHFALVTRSVNSSLAISSDDSWKWLSLTLISYGAWIA